MNKERLFEYLESQEQSDLLELLTHFYDFFAKSFINKKTPRQGSQAGAWESVRFSSFRQEIPGTPYLIQPSFPNCLIWSHFYARGMI